MAKAGRNRKRRREPAAAFLSWGDEPLADAGRVVPAVQTNMSGEVVAIDIVVAYFSTNSAGGVSIDMNAAGNRRVPTGRVPGAGIRIAGIDGSLGVGTGPGPGRGVVSRISGPDFGVGTHVGDIVRRKNTVFIIDNMVSMVSVVACDYGLILIDIPFTQTSDSGCGNGYMPDSTVFVQEDDYIPWANLFDGDLSGRSCISSTKNTVADEAGKSSTALHHADSY